MVGIPNRSESYGSLSLVTGSDEQLRVTQMTAGLAVFEQSAHICGEARYDLREYFHAM